MNPKRASAGGVVWAALLVIAFSAVLLAGDALVFWNDDYQTSILPVFTDMARSWSEGEWPLLSRYSWVCSNLAGEFQYGTFSVFINAAIVVIWKLPLTFASQAAAMSITHLVVLAAGSFMLARDRSFTTPTCLMVAIIGALNGWIICWGATDWFGALGAFAWLPWAWWSMERALNPQRSRYRFLWPAPFVYLLVTGGFPYTVLMLGVVAGWLTLRAAIEQRDRRAAWPMLLGIALGFALAAPAWLALLDYVRGSARETLPATAHGQWRVPLSAWPGLLWPGWTVHWSDFSSRLMPHRAVELACGILPVPLVAAATLRMRSRFVRQNAWLLGLLGVVFVLCMLPSASVFRWSFRWLPLFHLVLALCAAEALRSLGSTAGLRAWLCPATTYGALLATFIILPPNVGVPRYHLSESLREAGPLDPKRLYLSIYTASELTYPMHKHARPFDELRVGSTSMFAPLRFVNGYSPIRPEGIARAYAFTIHGDLEPAIAWYLLTSQDSELGELDLLGIDGLVIEGELHAAPTSGDWQEVYTSADAVVFHRFGPPLPTVRSLQRDAVGAPENYATANVTDIVEHRRSVRATIAVPATDKPALIAFSRPWFRGYVARFNGKTIPVREYARMMPMIELPPGTSGTLELIYRPMWLVVGLAISSAAGVAFLVCATLAAIQRK